MRLTPIATCLLLALPARADFGYEIGVRFERLHLDPIEFTCDMVCDVVNDPSCASVPDEQLCSEQSIEEPHDGWLVGALAGVSTGNRVVSGGLRLVGAVGPFEPKDETKRGEAGGEQRLRPLTLGHIALELPIEARFGARGTYGFVQLVPRVGILNYLGGKDEDADTFTGGVMLMAGVAFGGAGGGFALGGGGLYHPSFSGWMLQGSYRSSIGGGGYGDDDTDSVRDDRKPRKKKAVKKKKPEPKKKPRPKRD